MSMQQPIPPEQTPQTVDVQQTAPADTTVVPTETTVTETPVDVVTTDTVPVDTTAAPVDAQPATEAPAQVDEVTQQQVDDAAIETVANALAEDEITAEDIMVAILTETLGVSPNAAQSLFNLLLQDTMTDVADTADAMAAAEPAMDTTAASDAAAIDNAVDVQDTADERRDE